MHRKEANPPYLSIHIDTSLLFVFGYASDGMERLIMAGFGYQVKRSRQESKGDTPAQPPEPMARPRSGGIWRHLPARLSTLPACGQAIAWCGTAMAIGLGYGRRRELDHLFHHFREE
jgi:hypothetical protein